MVAGPCCVTDNVEGTTHNEMQALALPWNGDLQKE